MPVEITASLHNAGLAIALAALFGVLYSALWIAERIIRRVK